MPTLEFPCGNSFPAILGKFVFPNPVKKSVEKKGKSIIYNSPVRIKVESKSRKRRHTESEVKVDIFWSRDRST
jgi:hypothetical protein